MKPSWSILDRSHSYTPSHKTDVRKTWAKARKEQRAQADADASDEREREQKLVALKRKVVT